MHSLSASPTTGTLVEQTHPGTAASATAARHLSQETSAVPGVRDVLQATLPGDARYVAVARHLAEETLTAELSAEASDRITTAVLLLSELFTNAVAHTRSGDPGGTVRLRIHAHPVIRLEVDDDGADSTSPKALDPSLTDEHGRGLELVEMLADRWGALGVQSPGDGATVWFELTP